MKICILSDSHDNHGLIQNAVREAKALGAEMIFHCGDVVAAKTLGKIKSFGLPIHVIHGNNQGDIVTLSKVAASDQNQIHYYGQDASITLADKKIFLVHYPHYAKAMATTGDWDLVCCGHSHKAKINPVKNIKGGETLVVDPGSVGGVDSVATYVMGDLDAMEFVIKDVPLN